MRHPHRSQSLPAIFAEIERALSVTATGRAFLAAYAGRHRAQAPVDPVDAPWASGARSGDAGAGLDGAGAGRGDGPGPADRHSRLISALDAADRIQDAAWGMRETGVEPALCDRLDRDAAAIASALVPLLAPAGHAAEPAGSAMPPGTDGFWEELRQDAIARLDAIAAMPGRPAGPAER